MATALCGAFYVFPFAVFLLCLMEPACLHVYDHLVVEECAGCFTDTNIIQIQNIYFQSFMGNMTQHKPCKTFISTMVAQRNHR